MRLLALLLALTACTEVSKTVLPAQPPALEELPTALVVSWRDFTGAATRDGALLVFAPYPCLPLVGQSELGGEFEYASGRMTLETKSIGGDLKLTVVGQWSADLSFEGSYEATFLGVTCDAGEVRMR